MRRIAKYLKPYLWQIAAVLALVFVQAMTDLQLPDYMSQIVNLGVLAGDTGAILAIGLKMIGITLLGWYAPSRPGIWPAAWPRAMRGICAQRYLTKWSSFR